LHTYLVIMPINKNALIRYQTLDRCFRNSGRNYSIDELLLEVNRSLKENGSSNSGVNKRQLYYDIQFMQSNEGWSAPINSVRDGQRVYYRYSDRDYSINQQPLHEIEAEQIEAALAILSRFSGAPQFESIQEMIPKLRTRLGLDQVGSDVVSLNANLDLKGIEFLNDLYQAICRKSVLEVLYKNFKGEREYPISFHPYYLKQYNNRWFVFGYNEEKKLWNWNMALDRIVSTRVSDAVYMHSDIDWNDYFYDIIGVTNDPDRPVEAIKLEFSSKTLPYVLTKPLHPSQKLHQETDRDLIVIRVKQNYELESVILSFGENVRVVAPESLKMKIESRKTSPFIL
jgi:predicted DNA-binding transcriptional regulator YafY